MYLHPPDAETNESNKEMDYLYARVAQLQENVQQSKQKEQNAEGRLAEIMKLWEKEQAKCRKLEQELQFASHSAHAYAAKTDPKQPLLSSHSQHPAAVTPDQWRQLEDEMMMQSAQ